MKTHYPLLLFFSLALLAACVACGAAIPAVSPAPSSSLPLADGGQPVMEAAAQQIPLQADEAPPVAVSVRYVSGPVQVERGGEAIALASGGLLYEGDRIITGSGGLAVLSMASGKQLHIAASTIVELSLLIENEREESTALQLHEGTVISVIDQELDSGDLYEVETPGLVMAIRGTIASVSYDVGTENSSAALFEGKAVIHSKTNADVMEVSVGERAVTLDGKLERGALLPEALNESERIFLFDDAYWAPLAEDESCINTVSRLQGLLSTQEFLNAKAAYGAGNADTGAKPGEKAGSSTAKSKGDFQAIQQKFLAAKKDYGKGLISKEEFLRIKAEYIEAKKRYNK